MEVESFRICICCVQAGLERWLTGAIPVNGTATPAGKPLFEFVVTNDTKDSWDKPPAGEGKGRP